MNRARRGSGGRAARREARTTQQIEFSKYIERRIPNFEILNEEALELILKQPKRKFQETVDISVWLGIDPKKSEQNIRGSLTLPNSLGKEVKVAAFVDSDKADEAKKGGADFIGLDDLIEKYKDGNIDFDVAITTPAQMKNVSKLAKVLGPKGLMPSPKSGTVTENIDKAV